MKVITKQELASTLRVSVPALDRMRRAGKVPPPLAAMSQQQPRWLADEVESWLAAGTPPASEWARLRRDALAAR